ncbi:F-actin-capping protein subunit alpha [Thecamonas trahens ATCC 50062]|uniref:F-actin-capping protein subunit alpha n=1 Tax=Thecamonas trahens ATCC 50062 TaxID=461836 RepID=A0A0L0DBB4_THETB|nr:F-actin-capping protein subunit alpha [Thecamonas trahens ATCC 50062]KNC49406.1 F-actin-capping protein subunit alpha [Thecamonas trahens ATCC 50062]|eukprot:XP_013757830.1 F-actin-capping protein subunit alpha [Thecamonas trahens ATCC 50062]
MGDEYDIPDEEKLEIVTGFLLDAPPGEFNEVVTDVRTLLGNDDLLNQKFAATAQAYNTSHMVAVDLPDADHKVLLTKYGEISPSEYLDPRSAQVVTVDHAKLEVTGTAPAPAPGANEDTRAAVDAAMVAYVAEFYPNGQVATYATETGLVICISAAKFSPGNFWNGRWRSVWTVTINGEDVTFEGKFNLLVHYYEDGNVQLNSEFTTSTEVTAATPEEIAEAAAAEIAREESSYQSAVGESYAVMSERTFKGLRRKLPVTRHLMDWEKTAGYNLAREMGS